MNLYKSLTIDPRIADNDSTLRKLQLSNSVFHLLKLKNQFLEVNDLFGISIAMFMLAQTNVIFKASLGDIVNTFVKFVLPKLAYIYGE